MRKRMLGYLFNLLYSHLVFFHEPAGRVLFGRAWHERRLRCLAGLSRTCRAVDIGAGDGRLVAAARRRGLNLHGFEPSVHMRQAALRRSALVSRGWAHTLPMPGGRVDVLIATYPGPWIAAPGTWKEFDRVLSPDGQVRILFGGTYDSGPGATLRAALIRLAYGAGTGSSITLPAAVERSFTCDYVTLGDNWGLAHYMKVSRTQS